MTTDPAGQPAPQATHWQCLRCGTGGPVSRIHTGPPPLGGDMAARWHLIVHDNTCPRRTR